MNSKIKIGLFGLGTVGQGFVRVISMARNSHAEISRICVRNLSKPRDIYVQPELLTDNPDDILLDDSINLIVEVIDDADASYNIVKRAMQRGVAVVSGNKAMIARHLPELVELQKTTGAALLYDASSCGSIPVIRNLEEYYDNDLLLEVKGILNGSSNYILSRVFDHGEPYDQALAKAQALGFAEANPTFDIQGFDSLFKLVIITLHALGVYVSPGDVFCRGIDRISDFDIAYAREKGMKIKLVAQVVKVSDQRFTLFVMPEFVSPSKYIYSVDDEYNGVVIRGECYDRQFMFGKGAGALPTASSILSDVMARLHGYRYEYKKMSYVGRPEYTTDVELQVYLRYSDESLVKTIGFDAITERYTSDASSYVIGTVKLSRLIAASTALNESDCFICNIPRFFLDRD
ncbi:MAG: homoserine dehydrogenase [Odoribacter sp.]|nr:homoserine dehydrogenase [Odoribacter sp.]